MIEWGFLKKLFTISCIGTTIFTAGVSGSTSLTGCLEDEDLVIHRVSEETALGKTKTHKFHIRKEGHKPYQTNISIEDFTGCKVTLEGYDLSFVEERTGPENITSIHITHNASGFMEVSFVGYSWNDTTRFFYTYGQQVKIRIDPYQGSQQLVQKETDPSLTSFSKDKETISSKIDIVNHTFGNDEDEFRSEYRVDRRCWWMLAHKFQEVFITGHVHSGELSTQSYPAIQISGIALKQKGKLGENFPILIIAKIDKRSGRPKVEFFKGESREQPILSFTDFAPIYRQQSSNDLNSLFWY